MKKILSILALACIFAACDDDTKPNEDNSVCTDAQTQCTADGKIQTCSGGQWGAAQNCPANQTCRGTACAPIASVCNGTETRCTKDGQIQTCSGGQWGAAQNCPVANQSCHDKTCQETCTGTESRCTDDGKIQTCSGGFWGTAKNCSAANQSCHDNTCQETCTGDESRCTSDGKIEKCSGGFWTSPKECDANMTCIGKECIDISSPCTAGATQCHGTQIQYCESGKWGYAKNCPVNQECRQNACVTLETTIQKHALTCGNKTCSTNQLCQNDNCVDRTAKASQENANCDAKTFLESCDGNTLVRCVDSKIALTPCDEGEVCALEFHKNFGFCAIKDVNCNAHTEGEFTFCKYDGAKHYMELQQCALAADGYYYAFREEIETVDCLNTCFDAYSCDRADALQPCAREGEHCEGHLSVSCTPDKKTGKLEASAINCEDYIEYYPDAHCLATTGQCEYGEMKQ